MELENGGNASSRVDNAAYTMCTNIKGFSQKKSYLIYFTNSANGAGDTRRELLRIFVPDYDRADL